MSRDSTNRGSTPLMQQYTEIRRSCRNAILMFRMGILRNVLMTRKSHHAYWA
jgi:hypothetical protein